MYEIVQKRLRKDQFYGCLFWNHQDKKFYVLLLVAGMLPEPAVSSADPRKAAPPSAAARHTPGFLSG
jgi:hypothetical protein